MARQHTAVQEEEFKGSSGLWEFWVCRAPQPTSSVYRKQDRETTSQLWTTTALQMDPCLWIRTITHIAGHQIINMAENYQVFHPSLHILCTRDEPQACCICFPEEQRNIRWCNACLLSQNWHAKPPDSCPSHHRKQKEPFWGKKLFSYLILICPVKEKSLWICSENNWSHNSGVLKEKKDKQKKKNPCQHTEHSYVLATFPCI